jgi:hypothetical protein
LGKTVSVSIGLSCSNKVSVTQAQLCFQWATMATPSVLRLYSRHSAPCHEVWPICILRRFRPHRHCLKLLPLDPLQLLKVCKTILIHSMYTGDQRTRSRAQLEQSTMTTITSIAPVQGNRSMSRWAGKTSFQRKWNWIGQKAWPCDDPHYPTLWVRARHVRTPVSVRDSIIITKARRSQAVLWAILEASPAAAVLLQNKSCHCVAQFWVTPRVVFVQVECNYLTFVLFCFAGELLLYRAGSDSVVSELCFCI